MIRLTIVVGTLRLAAAVLPITALPAAAQRALPRNDVPPSAGPVVPWADASRNLKLGLRRALSGTFRGVATTETGPIGRIRVYPDRFSFLDKGTIAKESSTSKQAESYAQIREFTFGALGTLTIQKYQYGNQFVVNIWGTSVPGIKRGADRQRMLLFATREDAEGFVRAVHDVMRAAPNAREGDDAFARQAQSFRATNPRPALSDSANRHRVLAEAAVRDGNFEEAAAQLEAALAIDPLWPSGNFNLALVYEALEDWSEASRYMKRFLMLEPDSREAGSARDKLIVWEDRARRESGR